MTEHEDTEEAAAGGFDRKAFIKRLAVGAFAVPVVASFKLDSMASAGTTTTPGKDGWKNVGYYHPNQWYANQTFPNQFCPNQTYPNQIHPNQTYPNQTHPNQTHGGGYIKFKERMRRRLRRRRQRLRRRRMRRRYR